MVSLQLVLPGLLAIPAGLLAQFAAPAVLEVNPDSSSIPVWQFQYKVGVAGMAVDTGEIRTTPVCLCNVSTLNPPGWAGTVWIVKSIIVDCASGICL